MVQRKITVIEARKKLKNNNLNDHEIERILVKLYSLCQRGVDKTLEAKYGKS